MDSLYFKDTFDKEKEKEFSALNFRSKRRNLRVLPQIEKNKTNKDIDSRRKALLPGKRVSRNGNVYWETRANRTDSKGSTV